jgi:hypothetical protein
LLAADCAIGDGRESVNFPFSKNLLNSHGKNMQIDDKGEFIKGIRPLLG